MGSCISSSELCPIFKIKTVLIILHDLEIDDIFMLKAVLDNVKRKDNVFVIIKCVGDRDKFDKESLDAKKELSDKILGTSLPNIHLVDYMTDGLGMPSDIHNADVNKSFGVDTFNKIRDIRGKSTHINIDIISVSQSAPALGELLSEIYKDICTVNKLQIFLGNGGHNGRGMYKLVDLFDNINLSCDFTIHHTSSFSTMESVEISGDPNIYRPNTTRAFADNIKANKENPLALAILKYSLAFNKNVVTPEKVYNLIQNATKIGLNQPTGAIKTIMPILSKISKNPSSVSDLEFNALYHFINIIIAHTRKADVIEKYKNTFEFCHCRQWEWKLGLISKCLIQNPLHDIMQYFVYTEFYNTDKITIFNKIPVKFDASNPKRFLNVFKTSDPTYIISYAAKNPATFQKLLNDFVLIYIN
jgi:hypothetical protein